MHSKLQAIPLTIMFTLAAAHCQAPLEEIGRIAYFEGQAVLDDRDLSPEAAAGLTIRNGSKLSTKKGYAEVILSPGLIVTIDGNSELQFSASGGQGFGISLQQGSLFAIFTGPITGDVLTVTDQNGSVLINTIGWYRITADDPPRAAVIDGRAESRYGAKRVEIRKGREAVLTADLHQQSFHNPPNDEFYRWSEACLRYGFGRNFSNRLNSASTEPKPTETATALAQGKIRLSVIALDRKGDPVSDLQRSDFHVTDAGKTQQITSFRQAGNRAPRPTLILLDLLNERMSDRARAAGEIIGSIEKLESTQSLYLYVLALDGRLYPIHPVSSTLPEMEPAAEPWSLRIRTLLNDTLRQVSQIRPVEMADPDVRAQASLSLVETLASLLARVPGRKDLIWITHGFPEISYWADYTSATAVLGAKLNAAEIALYAVQQSVETGISINSGATLQLLCQLTGGRFYSSDQIESAIAQSRTDARAAYEMEYKAPLSRPAQYHKIRVACDRPGTRLLFQQGYSMLP